MPWRVLFHGDSQPPGEVPRHDTRARRKRGLPEMERPNELDGYRWPKRRCYPVTSTATEGLAIFAASNAMTSNVPVGLPSRER